MAHSRTRILVVDDDPVTRLTLRDALALEGYLVELEAEGAGALRLVQREPPPDVVKFSPECSTVTVSAGASDGRVTFTVRDKGGGIAPEAVANVFDQFWQAKQGRRSGVGLGLYIVKGIAEAHGGEIGVVSHLGVGSAFHLEIPERVAPVRSTLSWEDEAASNQWIPGGELSRAIGESPRYRKN